MTDARGFDGKIAVVTGGARGIGRAICDNLATAGARVVVGHRSRAGEAVAVRIDVADQESVADFVTVGSTNSLRSDEICCSAPTPVGPISRPGRSRTR